VQFQVDCDNANDVNEKPANMTDVDFSYESLADLQLSDFCQKTKKPWKHKVENSDPETRILDLTVVSRGNQQFVVGAACSDGIVR